MKTTKDTHVLLLKGGFGSEREVSLRSAKACSMAIKDNGLKVTEFDTGIQSIADLVQIKPDVCFNALHGKSGEDGSIQGFLNLLRIPYTHSGVTASAISMNKLYFKRIITNFTENVEKLNMKPIYLFIPYLHDLIYFKKNNIYYNTFISDLKKHMTVIDMTNEFMNYQIEDLYVSKSYGSHVSSLGNQIIAKYIKKSI